MNSNFFQTAQHASPNEWLLSLYRSHWGDGLGVVLYSVCGFPRCSRKALAVLHGFTVCCRVATNWKVQGTRHELQTFVAYAEKEAHPGNPHRVSNFFHTSRSHMLRMLASVLIEKKEIWSNRIKTLSPWLKQCNGLSWWAQCRFRSCRKSLVSTIHLRTHRSKPLWFFPMKNPGPRHTDGQSRENAMTKWRSTFLWRTASKECDLLLQGSNKLWASSKRLKKHPIFEPLFQKTPNGFWWEFLRSALNLLHKLLQEVVRAFRHSWGTSSSYPASTRPLKVLWSETPRRYLPSPWAWCPAPLWRSDMEISQHLVYPVDQNKQATCSTPLCACVFFLHVLAPATPETFSIQRQICRYAQSSVSSPSDQASSSGCAIAIATMTLSLVARHYFQRLLKRENMKESLLILTQRGSGKRCSVVLPSHFNVYEVSAIDSKIQKMNRADSGLWDSCSRADPSIPSLVMLNDNGIRKSQEAALQQFDDVRSFVLWTELSNWLLTETLTLGSACQLSLLSWVWPQVRLVRLQNGGGTKAVAAFHCDMKSIGLAKWPGPALAELKSFRAIHFRDHPLIATI